MKCQQCNQNQASIKLSFNLNGNTSEAILCHSCYEQQKSNLGATFNGQTPPSMNSFSMNDWLNEMNQQNTSRATKKQTENSFLDQFGRNLTSIAKTGLIDPVIGRDKEIQQVIEILNRRNKNNPVLIGEPGVGKTAIAEGLASKIATGDVPIKLKNKQVYLLDVASLVANTGIRGQFEERMKKLISELQQKKNIILFIDELHLVVGAGSAEGSMDAGNILKPALARGELQLVGATTLKEYRQIEKDAALERRFQPVMVKEPSLEEAFIILKGLKEKYEEFHSVNYTDEALKACVELSHRYIQDRYLPDKAIDLLDQVGSKLNLSLSESDHSQLRERLNVIHKEKEDALKQEKYERAAKLRDEELQLEKRLSSNDRNDNTKVTVDIQHIQSIIEEKTGIPVTKLHQDEKLRVKLLEGNLQKKVIGQSEAVSKVSKAIRRSRTGFKRHNRPIGSFLFVGPTGVGKTELTKSLAEELFGTKESMIRLDMSEYMERHSISKIIGSPPGYVGHEEAGQLTEKVRRNPYSIILLDEIEKAHPDVQHLFLQILEDGRLTDSQGKTVSFKETVIIMTSNAGQSEKRITVGFGKEDYQESNIIDSIKMYFKPEFLNRLDSVIEFKSLGNEDLLQIVDLMLSDVYLSLDEQKIKLELSHEVKQQLVTDGFDPAFGARPLRRVIQQELEDQIVDIILEEPNVKTLSASVENNKIVIQTQ
ncbi:ATP-dependent Clp protease ATP-binding subunit [Bacillus spongiae]|uniref:ATP-dependent Clp protease ATP-binding subunit n=1 Tax=Bacillus spongiae TaxID=2683610 RepID=A0ABU8H9R2_9BACI